MLLQTCNPLVLRSGRFGVSPRFGRDGQRTGWRGMAELVLEGHVFARVAVTAAKLPTLAVSSVVFGLSQKQRTSAVEQARRQAIAQFRQRAAAIARDFGFSSYVLGDVDVRTDGGFPPVRPMLMTARVATTASPLPLEAGSTAVSVTVSGSVYLR